jgi:hypothetical protein
MDFVECLMMRYGIPSRSVEAEQSPSISPAARLYSEGEGRAHSIWTNPRTGDVETVRRHVEIPDRLAQKICRWLSIPEIGRYCTMSAIIISAP